MTARSTIDTGSGDEAAMLTAGKLSGVNGRGTSGDLSVRKQPPTALRTTQRFQVRVFWRPVDYVATQAEHGEFSSDLVSATLQQLRSFGAGCGRGQAIAPGVLISDPKVYVYASYDTGCEPLFLEWGRTVLDTWRFERFVVGEADVKYLKAKLGKVKQMTFPIPATE